MKNLVISTLFLIGFLSLASAQETKTIMTNLNDWVLDVTIKGDTIISGGDFTSPFNHICLSNVATGSTVAIGNGIPTPVTRIFFLPWDKNILYAGTNAEPYLYRYDFANFTIEPDWVPDTFFQVTGEIYDVDVLPNQVALATDGGTIVLHQSGEIDLFPTTVPGSVALNVQFDLTLSNGTLFIGERTGSSQWDYHEILYQVKEGTKSPMPLGYLTDIYSLEDMAWYEGKLLILGYLATVPDNGWHMEMLISNGVSWQSFTNGDDCPYIHRLSVSNNRIFVTGTFGDIEGIDLGPVVAEYNGTTWIDPFPSSSGVGYAIATEDSGKWTVASGGVTTTLNPTYGLTQLLVFGSEIPTYTGIETSENLLDLEVSLFPNPANDHILIEAPVNAPVAIYNLMGQIVYTGITNTRMEIDLPAGQYIARVQNEDATVNKVFIVVH